MNVSVFLIFLLSLSWYGIQGTRSQVQAIWSPDGTATSGGPDHGRVMLVLWLGTWHPDEVISAWALERAWEWLVCLGGVWG